MLRNCTATNCGTDALYRFVFYFLSLLSSVALIIGLICLFVAL